MVGEVLGPEIVQLIFQGGTKPFPAPAGRRPNMPQSCSPGVTAQERWKWGWCGPSATAHTGSIPALPAPDRPSCGLLRSDLT